MKKPNLQRLAQRSKIYLRKASPTILSGLGAAGVIVYTPRMDDEPFA